VKNENRWGSTLTQSWQSINEKCKQVGIDSYTTWPRGWEGHIGFEDWLSCWGCQFKRQSETEKQNTSAAGGKLSTLGFLTIRNRKIKTVWTVFYTQWPRGWEGHIGLEDWFPTPFSCYSLRVRWKWLASPTLSFSPCNSPTGEWFGIIGGTHGKDCVLFMSRLKKDSGLPYKIVFESWNPHASSSSQEALLWKVAAWGSREKQERSQSVLLTLPASYSLLLRVEILFERHTHTYMHMHIHAYRPPPRLPSPPTLPPPLRHLTSKPALILPFVYGHVVWSKKWISPWFHCPLSGGRTTLYFTVFWAVGRRPTPSSECGPEAHTQNCSPSLSQVRCAHSVT